MRREFDKETTLKITSASASVLKGGTEQWFGFGLALQLCWLVRRAAKYLISGFQNDKGDPRKSILMLQSRVVISFDCLSSETLAGSHLPHSLLHTRFEHSPGDQSILSRSCGDVDIMKSWIFT